MVSDFRRPDAGRENGLELSSPFSLPMIAGRLRDLVGQVLALRHLPMDIATA